jgi:hypothetical protein
VSPWPEPGETVNQYGGELTFTRRIWCARTEAGMYMRRVRYLLGDVVVLEVVADDEAELDYEAKDRADTLLGDRLRRALEDE